MEFVNMLQARQVLEVLLSRGGDFGEIYCQSNQYTRIFLDDGKLEEIASGEDSGVALRLVAGEQTFFSSGNAMDLDSLRDQAGRLALARETDGANPGRVG